MKLNLGSFTVMFPGWLNIDLRNDPFLFLHAAHLKADFMSMDIRGGIPFPDESVELIFSSHMLEHLTYEEGERLLKDCYRLLKPGGVARISVPDMQTLVSLYTSGNTQVIDKVSETATKAKYATQKVWEVLVAGHMALYDFETMKQMAEPIGFTVERRYPNQGHPVIVTETKDLFPEISLFVELTKQ